MKKITLSIFLILGCNASALMTQTPDYKAVFDLTSKDTKDYKVVI